MAEVSGNPIVSKADNCAASYIKTQDYLLNPFATSGVTINNLITYNFTGFSSATTSTITAANSGPFAPLGFMVVQISGANAKVPFFAP